MKLLATIVSFVSLFVTSNANAAGEALGCEELRMLVKLERISVLSGQAYNETNWEKLSDLHQLICRTVAKTGDTLKYANGQLATDGFNVLGATWYYSDGKTATQDAGEVGADWYYPNGTLASDASGKTGGSWSYSQGSLATQSWGMSKAAWYYPSGELATQEAGVVKSVWYYPNGGVGTEEAGLKKAKWYYSDGKKIANPIFFDKSELLDAPRVIMWMLATDPNYASQISMCRHPICRKAP